MADFQSHFRMTRTTFGELSHQLGLELDTPQAVVPVTKRMTVAIWTFANQEVYRYVKININNFYVKRRIFILDHRISRG